jgi:hypothetical protein
VTGRKVIVKQRPIILDDFAMVGGTSAYLAGVKSVSAPSKQYCFSFCM